MRVGIDQFTLHPYKNDDPYFAIQWVHEHKLDGVQFGNIIGAADTLDHGRIKALRQACADRGLYSEISVGVVNPLAGGKSRPVEELTAQLTRQIETAAALGWHELHSNMGAQAERFRVTPTWRDQLEASAAVLMHLRPVLKANGCHINLENHGDSTTFELVRLIHEVGPDVLGICLDTANVLCHCEDPLESVRRVAPYVRQTHTKDAIVYLSANGYSRQGRAPGDGVLPWPQIIQLLLTFNPDLNLSIEDHKWQWEFSAYDAAWQAHHPDLTCKEMGLVLRSAWQMSQRITAGEVPEPETYEKIPYLDQVVDRVTRGASYLKQVIAQALPESP